MVTESAYAKVVFDRREEQWTHVPYYTELDMLEIIKRGEPERIPRHIRDMFPPHNGHMSEDPLRQAVYEFVACATLATRFAVEGGAPSEQVYTLSDAYIKSADKAETVDEVHALYEKALTDFATRVKRAGKASGKPLSFPVSRAIEYIDGNLHRKLTLEDIGEAVNRNPAYLCVLFKSETGVSISEYINREKVESAKHLLRDTDMPVSEVSETLSFGSQSYFTKLFRERTGKTPKAYRREGLISHR